jgi:nitrate reductase assembly molybdenum cofactor insertion protein NarJ
MRNGATCKTEKLLAHAAAWRLASLLLERPRPQWQSEIVQLSAEVSEPQLSACVSEADQATEELYHWIFGPGGTVSPREVSYCGFEDPGRVMAELQFYYRAFSFQPQREESIDHISVEAGFTGYLFLKEAYAQLGNDAETIEITRDARLRFTKEHLTRCAQGMIHRPTDMPPYIKNALSWLAEKGAAL